MCHHLCRARQKASHQFCIQKISVNNRIFLKNATFISIIKQRIQQLCQFSLFAFFPGKGIQLKNVQQAIQMQINQLPFEQKLALAMDANLCAQVLGAKPATEPSNYYVTTVRGSTTDRMRVFDLPSSDWTEKMIVKLKSEE